MFGTNKKFKIASEFDALADQSQNEIEALKAQNPFETAAAKSAMAKASLGAQNYYSRAMNTMGANASPEAQIAAQGQAGQTLGSAAGEIAVGSEANKTAQINALKTLQQNQMATAAGIKTQAIDQAWQNMFNAVDTAGGVMSGAGQSAGTLLMASGKGQAAGTLLMASDQRLKENIVKIGEIQGQQIYKFNYIGDSRTTIGVIAQEVDDESCVGIEHGYLHVNYDKLFKEAK